MSTETHEFKAEVAALLKLVTSSLYANTEVFLRELVSNASDALDKARYQALVQPEIAGQDLDPKITIVADSQAGTLTIEDNGIGLTRDEAARNLGTIAHSGTLQFLTEMKRKAQETAGKQVDLIGQFGVGFYSSFMVADEVVVHTRSALPDSDAVCWTSTGSGSFEMDDDDRTERGTRIVLTINEDSKEFLDGWRIRAIVRRYSNYVMHPIELVTVDAEGARSEPEQINSAQPLWSRKPADISDDDYAEFYKHVMGGFVLPGDEPVGRLHFSAEAPIQFNALLFVPGRAPADLFMEDRKALQLYARRVLVMESNDQLLPGYLRFFRGVVDSEDLPLNVSREMLQEHRSLAAIRRQLTRKALKLLEDLASDDAEKYARLWREFGPVIKEGIHMDGGNREALIGLTRWKTLAKGEEWVSLASYVEAMPEDQDAIYYVAGNDEKALRRSPHIEALRKRGHDVFLMTDTVDEWVLQNVTEFGDKPIKNVAQGDLDETDAAEEAETAASPIDPLLIRARDVLGERVKDVRASSRLTDSASCLVDAAGGMSRNMERILRMARRDADAATLAAPRVLELNPEHPFVVGANARAADGDDQPVNTWIELLFDLAALAEGDVPDPPGTVRRIQMLLDAAVGATA